MKIMIIGEWIWPHYENAFSQGLSECDVEVVSLSVSKFFKGFLGRIQTKLPLPGPAIIELNKAIIKESKSQKPDWVLFWRPTHILPNTVKYLGEIGVKTISYNNDDPFGPKAHGKVPWHHHFIWYWYLKALPHFKYNFFYRKINCIEAKSIGVKYAEVMLPYFMPWKDRPVNLTEFEKKRYQTEVVFVGHYENDNRVNYISSLVNSGIKVKIWGGPYWNRTVLGDLYDKLAPIVSAEGEEYSKSLCGALVCLCFLSKLNRDTYTRRCFEIPACGKVMLAERTDELLNMFIENKEACFFSSVEELVVKAKWLIDNPDIANQIGQAGLKRVWKDGHDVKSRANWFIKCLSNG